MNDIHGGSMDMVSLDHALAVVANLSEKSAILGATSTMIDPIDNFNATNTTNRNSSTELPSSTTHEIDWTDLVLALILCVLIVVS